MLKKKYTNLYMMKCKIKTSNGNKSEKESCLQEAEISIKRERNNFNICLNASCMYEYFLQKKKKLSLNFQNSFRAALA